MKSDDLPAAAHQSEFDARAAEDTAWRAVHAAACAPYRGTSRWAWHWARGKLERDPVFRGMLERGDLRPAARVVDVGCGQGLVASLLQACTQVAAQGGWPATWPDPPSAQAYTGIELMPSDAARAQAALAPPDRAAQPGFTPQFVCADMREAALPACDAVVILDVLHYVPHAAQQALLARVRGALASSPQPGRLLLRVGDAADARRFGASQLVDRVVTAARGHRAPPTWGRPLAAWRTLLRDLGFVVQAVPMSRGTPFANVLLAADLGPRPAPEPAAGR